MPHLDIRLHPEAVGVQVDELVGDVWCPAGTLAPGDIVAVNTVHGWILNDGDPYRVPGTFLVRRKDGTIWR